MGHKEGRIYRAIMLPLRGTASRSSLNREIVK